MIDQIAQAIPYGVIVGLKSELQAVLGGFEGIRSYNIEVENGLYMVKVDLVDALQFHRLCKAVVGFTEYQSGFTCYEVYNQADRQVFDFMSTNLKTLAFRCRLELQV